MSTERSVAYVCRALSITEQTYYRWRNEHSGFKVDQIKRLKDLERENTRLKRAVVDPLPRNARHPEMLHA
jgi:transposase-like protein